MKNLSKRNMATRAHRVSPKTSLDFYPTPPWATRALCLYVIRPKRSMTAWEPACGEGHMAMPLAEYFGTVHATDIAARGYGGVHNFLSRSAPPVPLPVDWIVTNPPFNRAEHFILRALPMARVGVAILARLSFLESVDRWRKLFVPHPPTYVAQFTERVPMLRGRLRRKASTAACYAWFVWLKTPPGGSAGSVGGSPQVVWLPPCRKQLQRLKDYRPLAAPEIRPAEVDFLGADAQGAGGGAGV